jgi:cytochrome P450
MTRPTIAFDELLADPLAALGRARAQHWLADADGGVAVLAHERVRELLADGRLRATFVDFLRNFGITSGPFFEWMAVSPLNRDGAEHQRWRSLMARTFTPRSVERLRPFLRAAAHQLIDDFAARGACEFMAEFADVYPSLGLCELIGVPTEDRDRFRDWSNTIGLGFNPVELVTRIAEVDAALLEMVEYTAALAARRLTEPREDLVTRIAQAGQEAGWTAREVSGSIAGLVFAGHETTKNQLGWMVAVLAERPDVWESVAGGGLDCATAVEELLRYRSTVTTVGRVTDAPLETDGETIPAGTNVFLSLWSANHDPAAFAHPDAVAPAANDAVPHIAFGHGAHHCLGAALARAELQDALAALTTRLTCPRIGADAAWRPPVGINGPERLPISFTARGL